MTKALSVQACCLASAIRQALSRTPMSVQLPSQTLCRSSQLAAKVVLRLVSRVP